jgi:hypothetical protein
MEPVPGESPEPESRGSVIAGFPAGVLHGSNDGPFYEPVNSIAEVQKWMCWSQEGAGLSEATSSDFFSKPEKI